MILKQEIHVLKTIVPNVLLEMEWLQKFNVAQVFKTKFTLFKQVGRIIFNKINEFFQSVIVIQRVQLQTFVIQRLVNAYAKMGLVAQDVINVHLDFSKISTYLSSNVILVIVLRMDLPQKYVILQMANVHANMKTFQVENAINAESHVKMNGVHKNVKRERNGAIKSSQR